MTQSNATNKMVVVGYGYLGSRICGIIAGARLVQDTWRRASMNRVEVAAIVEPDGKRAREASRQFPSVPVVESIDKLDMRHFSKERAFIRDFAPLSERARLLEFAEAHRIDVLLEKPIPEVCLFNQRADRSIRVGVGMSEVNNPVVASMRYLTRKNLERIDSVGVARVNSIFDIRNSFDPGHRTGIEGGAFLDKMIHDLHLLDRGYYLGSPAQSIEFVRLNDMKFNPKTGEDVYSDVSLRLTTARDATSVKLISSWNGVPDDLHERLGVEREVIEKSTLKYRLNGSGLIVNNLKIAVISGVNANGEKVSIAGNLQSRGHLAAGIWITSGNEVKFREIRFNVPILETITSFLHGKHTPLADVASCHRAAYTCSRALVASRLANNYAAV